MSLDLYKSLTTTEQEPLKDSHEVNDIEAELKQVVFDITKSTYNKLLFDSNVLGVPFLGSNDLISRTVVNEGLTPVRSISDDVANRYLLKAWLGKNAQGRGTEFLQTYFQLQYPNAISIAQLWQDKNKPYPTDLSTIESDNRFLTSRLLIDIDIRKLGADYRLKSEEILGFTNSARDVIAARFVPKFLFRLSCDDDAGGDDIAITDSQIQVDSRCKLKAIVNGGLINQVFDKTTPRVFHVHDIDQKVGIGVTGKIRLPEKEGVKFDIALQKGIYARTDNNTIIFNDTVSPLLTAQEVKAGTHEPIVIPIGIEHQTALANTGHINYTGTPSLNTTEFVERQSSVTVIGTIKSDKVKPKQSIDLASRYFFSNRTSNHTKLLSQSISPIINGKLAAENTIRILNNDKTYLDATISSPVYSASVINNKVVSIPVIVNSNISILAKTDNHAPLLIDSITPIFSTANYQTETVQVVFVKAEIKTSSGIAVIGSISTKSKPELKIALKTKDQGIYLRAWRSVKKEKYEIISPILTSKEIVKVDIKALIKSDIITSITGSIKNNRPEKKVNNANISVISIIDASSSIAHKNPIGHQSVVLTSAQTMGIYARTDNLTKIQSKTIAPVASPESNQNTLNIIGSAIGLNTTARLTSKFSIYDNNTLVKNAELKAKSRSITARYANHVSLLPTSATPILLQKPIISGVDISLNLNLDSTAVISVIDQQIKDLSSQKVNIKIDQPKTAIYVRANNNLAKQDKAVLFDFISDQNNKPESTKNDVIYTIATTVATDGLTSFTHINASNKSVKKTATLSGVGVFAELVGSVNNFLPLAEKSSTPVLVSHAESLKIKAQEEIEKAIISTTAMGMTKSVTAIAMGVSESVKTNASLACQSRGLVVDTNNGNAKSNHFAKITSKTIQVITSNHKPIVFNDLAVKFASLVNEPEIIEGSYHDDALIISETALTAQNELLKNVKIIKNQSATLTAHSAIGVAFSVSKSVCGFGKSEKTTCF